MEKLPVPAQPWVIVIGFEHNREAVDWQCDQLFRELASMNSSPPIVVKGPEANPIWQALTAIMAGPDSTLTFKANLLSSATADYCRWLNTQEVKPRLQAHAGNGIVLGHLTRNWDRQGVY